MKKNVFVFAAFAALAFSAQAGQQSNISAERSKCYDRVDLGGMKNSQWASCEEAELARLDVKLNSVYKQARAKMSEEEKKALTQAQRDWLKFRESSCKLWEVQNLQAPSGYHGYTSCMTEMTDKRVSELRDWAQ
ncbi:lysozyme inhibitor LprI family protein [Comamonas sp. F1-6]|uniref:lysozyme inhibitor LprI family protein n=1 Tax=Comamonas sp. F1-6 TaxID=673550 RepID=UPI0031DC4565